MKKLAQISNLCKYGHKIYVNYVSHMFDDDVLYEEIDNHFLKMKFDYFNTEATMKYQEIYESYEYNYVKGLNSLISNCEDIFENFCEDLIDYYPNDILTLFNYYKN